MHLISFLQTNPTAFYLVAAVLGLLTGSFLNVVIHRLPRMMQAQWQDECCQLLEIDNTDKKNAFNLIAPRSACPHCGHKITALENIPVFSYLFLKGKCSGCKTHISLRYPVIELCSALLALITALHFGFTLQMVFALLLGWVLLTLSMIDLDTQLLPDDITLPFLWLGILVNMFGLFTDIYSSLIGAMLGYLSLWSVYMVFKLITGKEGMGYGDFKLLAMLGAWLGWQALPLIIILSSLIGALAGLSLMLFRHHQRSVPIPFGPYLAGAGWVALLYGDEIMQAYYRWSMGAG